MAKGKVSEAERELARLKLAKLKALEDEARLREMLPYLHGFKDYKWSEEFINDWTHKYQVLTAANQLGKAQDVDELIPTPNGWVRFGDLRIGDSVFGDDGKPCKVTGIPFEGMRECYEIEFDDKTSIISSGEHLWRCKGYHERFRGKTLGQWVVCSTQEMYLKGKYNLKSHRPIHRYVIPYCEPIQYKEKSLFIDPYIMGLFIGDGSFAKNGAVSFSKEDDEVISVIEKAFDVKRHKSPRLIVRAPNGTLPEYMRCKGSHQKFVPDEYMHGSVEQRLALLQGLMDTDGTVNAKGDVVEFDTSSKVLHKQVLELVFSLGGTAKASSNIPTYTHNGVKKEGRRSYCLRIKLPPGMSPFRLARKKERWAKLSGEIRYKHERVIRKIKKIGVKKVMCISVSSPKECYVIGKNHVVTHNSTSLWRKLIKVMFDPTKWDAIWPDVKHTGQKPSQWWYLYPSKPVATIEFEEKVIPLLPKVPKTDPTYGWDVEYQYGHAHKLYSNTGINIYFKTYAQDAQNLQAGTVFVAGCDEEVPVDILPELQMRINATNGFLFFVFTATMGQPFWRQVVEERTQWEEARIWQVSLFDSMEYTDGTPSRWTRERIEQAIKRCTTKAEVQRRIHGKFVVDEGLKYPTFDRERHLKPYHRVPSDWSVYAGVDGGSGGVNHPASVAFVAVNPERTKGRVIRLWRGDGGSTTADDVMTKYLEMSTGLNVVTAFYDWAAKDLGTIAQRMGLPFVTAEKSHEIGESTLNTLFKSNALCLYTPSEQSLAEGIPDEHLAGHKFAQEIESLLGKTAKKDAIDDAVDAVRYCITKLQWDWPVIIQGQPEEKTEVVLTGEELRQSWRNQKQVEKEPTLEEEMDYWEDLLNG